MKNIWRNYSSPQCPQLGRAGRYLLKKTWKLSLSEEDETFLGQVSILFLLSAFKYDADSSLENMLRVLPKVLYFNRQT